jgi:dihydropteroate synthase
MAVKAGLPDNKIIVDPGIGFGKTPAENRLLLKRLRDFRSLGKPVLLAASRKAFIGATLGLDVDQRLEGSLAAVAIGIINGADIVRVHDVEATRRLAEMIDAVRREDG